MDWKFLFEIDGAVFVVSVGEICNRCNCAKRNAKWDEFL